MSARELPADQVPAHWPRKGVRWFSYHDISELRMKLAVQGRAGTAALGIGRVGHPNTGPKLRVVK